MRKLWNMLAEFFRRGDLLLLFLCTVTSVFGIIIISSATNYFGSSRFVVVQAAALVLGILLYIFVSLLDIEILAEHRQVLVIFNMILLSLLLVWGVEGNTGNKAWLDLPLLPVNIQPAEICKIAYVIVLAKTMSVHRGNVSSFRCVLTMLFVVGLMIGMIIVISKDAGSALVFIFIFLVMAYVGGVRGAWFLAGFGLTGAALPFVWKRFVRADQKDRILMFFDSSIDPSGEGVRWDTIRSVTMLSGGGVSGQGLYQGTMTQAHSISAQHTDFIFSVIGEELGILGCLFTVLLLTLIIIRCAWVGIRTQNYMHRLICIGLASMMVFQVLINVGMCIGVFPVIGLTLPFISYGGSSVVTMFLAMGIVSGIHMHSDPESSSLYIRYRY